MFLFRYSSCSCQFVNADKSNIFFSIFYPSFQASHNCLILWLQNQQLIYLGIPIFRGKLQAAHLQPITDKINSKLAVWKTFLLSIASKTQLVKTGIESMLTYSITIYAWLVSLLKDLVRWIKKCCLPLKEGGLGLRSLTTLKC